MIIDSIENASKYYGIHPLFEKAFAYINATDLQNVFAKDEATKGGKYEIDGDNLRAAFSNKIGMSTEESPPSLNVIINILIFNCVSMV